MSQVKWINTSGGDFATAANWMGGVVPGVGDDAIFNLAGPYTVTSNQGETVNSVQLAQGVTLSIGSSSNFDALIGTGSGANAGLILVGNNSFFETSGTIAGSGTVDLNSAGNGTRFQLEANTTLTGGGKLVMSDNANNYVISDGGPYTLTNVNDTISGAGQFLYNNTSFTNGAAGVLNANAASNALVVNAGTGTIGNAGLFEATGNAGLDIQNSSITQTGTGTIKAVGLGHNVSLDGGSITGGTLTTTGGGLIQALSTNGAVTNVTISTGSTVAALNNAYLYVGGTIINKGTIALNSGGNATELRVNSGTLTLTGAGAVVLTDNGNNYIYAQSAGNLLVNVNNTISGAGQLTYNGLAFDNQLAGVINATGTVNALVVDTGGQAFSNEGLLEDTGTGGLVITDSTVIGNKGTILAAGAGSHVDLNTGSIQGGTLKTSGGGVIQSVNNFGLDGSTKLGAVTLTTGSQLAVLNNNYLVLTGSIVNDGTIALDSGGNATELRLNGTVTLTGGGAVTLSDNTNNYLYSLNNSDKLINVNNVISGSGNLAYNALAFDNRSAGIINSNGTAGMTLDSGGQAFSNEGLIEDTGTGGFAVTDGTVIANAGTIEALGTGSHVDLNTGSIQGGTLKTGGGGVIQVVNYFGLDGSTALGAINLAANSQVAVLNDEYLLLTGTIVNGGTISLDSGGNATELRINGTVTLTGGGAVTLSDNGANYLYALNQTDTLVNVDNTITGSGQFGANYLTIDNKAAGVINSSGTAGMTVDNGAKPFTNEGLIEDTGTGGFTLVDGTTITNNSTILAAGVGSSVDLYSGAILGGTVSTSNGGVINITGNGGLYGQENGALTLTAGTQVAVLNSEYLYVDGTIINHGTISLDSAGNGTRLQVSGVTTLTGGGTIALSDNSQNYLYSINQTDTLVNVNNVITGSGQLAYNFLTVDNQAAGVIVSTGAAGMVLDTAAARAFTNEGLIKDTGTGGFTLVDGSTITNSGTILATGAGSSVDLYSGAILGGTVSTSNGGVINITGNGGLYGQENGALTLTAGTQVAVLNSEYLYVDGTIINHGTISLDSAGNGTRLQVSGVTTLTGGGTIALSDNSQNYLYSINQTDTLVNVNNVITGSGQMAYNFLTIDNQAAGVIDSTGAAGMTFNPGGKALTNEGTLEATGTGGIFIQATTLTNTGTIAAFSDSFVTINNDAVLTNYNAGTLAGGTYEAISAGGTHTATIAINSIGTIGVDASTLVLSGVGSTITAGGIAVETTINTITARGALELLNGRNITETNAFSNAGLLLLSGSTFTQGSGKFTNTGTVLAQSGGVLSLGKSVNITNLTNGTLTGGTWEAIGNKSTISLGSGIVSTDAAAITVSFAGSVFQSGAPALSLEATLATITSAGALSVLGGRAFASVTSGGLTDAGVITLGGGTLSASGGLTITPAGTFAGTGALNGAVVDNGKVETGGPGIGTLTLGSALTGTGLLASTAGDTLNATAGYSIGTVNVAAGSTLVGAGTASGAIAIAGTLALVGGTLSGGSIATIGTAGLLTGRGSVTQSVTNAGTIDAAGGTLTLAGGETGGALAAENGGALVSNAAVGAVSLSIAAGGSFTGFGSISGMATDNGSLTANGGTLSIGTLSGSGNATVATGAKLTSANAVALAGNLTIASGGSFAGYGSVAGTATDNGTLTATGGLLSIGHLNGSGSATVAAAATLTSANAATLGGSLTIAAGGSFMGFGSVAGTATDNGSLVVVGGALSLGGLSGTGGASVHTNASLSVASALSLGSLTIIAAGSFSGFGAVTGAIADNGALTATGGLLSAGTLSGSGSATVAAGATLTASTALAFTGALTIAAGGSFAGFGSASGAIADNGTLSASGGNLSLGPLTGSGGAIIDAGATLTLSSPLTLGGGLSFATGGDALSLSGASGNTTTLSGFASGDTIDLRNTVVTSDLYKKGVLTLKNGAAKLGTLKFAGKYSAANFTLGSDGNGGTNIVFHAGPAAAVSAIADLQSAATAIVPAASVPAPAAAAWSGGEPLGIPSGWAELGTLHVSDLVADHLFAPA